MADTTTDDGTAKDDVQLVIPDETKQKFPELVQMVIDSKSMNNQERNYWLQVLPVMTEDQVKELRDILETEIKKLAEIEKKYGKKEEKKEVELTPEDIEKMEQKKREERMKRKQAEEKAAQEENPDDLLAALGL